MLVHKSRILIVALLLVSCASISQNPPPEVISAIGECIDSGSLYCRPPINVKIPATFTVKSAQKSPQPSNYQWGRQAAEEVWCIVTDPPIVDLGQNTDNEIKNYLVWRVGLRWSVISNYTSLLNDKFLEAGCTNYDGNNDW